MKLSKSIFYPFLHFFFVALIFFGCKKEIFVSTTTQDLESQSDKELIANAKSYFDKEINSQQSNQTNAINNSVKTHRQLLSKKAAFGASIIEKMPVGKIVTTPISFNDKEMYVGNKQNFSRLSSSTFLISYTDKKQKKQVELVTKVPDQVYLNDTTNNKRFSGIITVEDWYGNFIKAFKYDKGEITAKLGAPENSISTINAKSINSVKVANGIYCYTIEYWSYAIITSLPVKQVNDVYCCNFIDSETFCENDGGGTLTNDINEQINYSQVGSPTTSPGGGSGCGIATGNSIKGGKVINDVTDQCPPVADPPVLTQRLDTSKLSNAPKIKAIVKDLPNFIRKYPNIINALAYYTGFTTTQIQTMMTPGVGVSVGVVHNLLSGNGIAVVGQYDPNSQTLLLSDNLESALENSYLPEVQEAVALLAALSTLHEFVHYGRDVNHLSYYYVDSYGNQIEAGWEFEYSISYDPNTGITAQNSTTWINFYPYSWSL